jgi:hypothetical protein
MEKLFLKAKHWQIFILVFGIPLVFQVIFIFRFLSNLNFMMEPDLNDIIAYTRYILIIVMIVMVITYSWFWSMAIGLQYKVPTGVKMKVTLFKIFFIMPIVYLVLFSVFVLSILTSGEFPNPFIILIILPVHFFVIFCSIYCIHFIAKTIKTVELQREVKFSDFVAEFFMMWFYPIGVWILQPRINKFIESESSY